MSKKPLKVIAGASDRPLVIAGVEISCFVLEDETRVLVQRGLATGIGMSKPSGVQVHRFASSSSMSPFVSNALIEVLDNPIRFLTPNGIGHGYPASILVDLCTAVLAARDARALKTSQTHIASRADLLIRGLATVGIIALVDEATGYQEIRDRLDLHKLLDRFLLKEHAKWAKRFPDEFYQEIFRLKDWQWQGMKVNRPSVVGRYTNDLVWDRIAPGVRKELERLNPKKETGSRARRHHQWLTDDIGHPSLQKHLIGVIALMKSVRTEYGWDECLRRIQRVYPKVGRNSQRAS